MDRWIQRGEVRARDFIAAVNMHLIDTIEKLRGEHNPLTKCIIRDFAVSAMQIYSNDLASRAHDKP